MIVLLNILQHMKDVVNITTLQTCSVICRRNHQ